MPRQTVGFSYAGICVMKGDKRIPNTQNRGNRDFSRFDNMESEEMEKILRLDAQNTEGKESDLEMILYVMEVLAGQRRNSDNPGKTAQEAFRSFKENYLRMTSITWTVLHIRVSPEGIIKPMPAFGQAGMAAATAGTYGQAQKKRPDFP